MNYEELKALLTQAGEHNSKGNLDESDRLTNIILAEFEMPINKEALSSKEARLLHINSYLSLANTARQSGNFDVGLDRLQSALVLAEVYSLQEIQPRVWNMIGNVHYSLGIYDKALEYFSKSLSTYEARGEKSGIALVTGNFGNVYLNIGIYDKALEYYSKALSAFESLKEKSSVALAMGNIGNVYLNLGNHDKALEYYSNALSIHEELSAKSSVALVTGNIGLVYFNLGSHAKAFEYLLKALSAYEETGEKSSVAFVTGNIGIVYYSLGIYDKALEYFSKALSTNKELGVKSSVARVTGNIGSLYASRTFDGYNILIAEEYLFKAIALGEEIGAKALLSDQHNSLGKLYKAEKQWENFAVHFQKFYELEKELQNEEATKQAQLMEHRRKIEESERDRQVKLARFQEQEKILHNILPSQIADRMIEGEKTIVDSYESVSVLFADIVGFTKLSQRVTPEQLVAGLDGIFNTFDLLADKHGCEKIKTIGDCYMVVAGLPERCDNHAERLGAMALDMLKAIGEFPAIVEDVSISMRIGIHSGSVVAGIIGKNKYAYDLWGDAVNTASRMESHGEAGRIHVSEDFVKQITQTPKNPTQTLPGREGFSSSFSFPLGEGRDGVLIERGEMEIKGKGTMKTYFLEKV
jgi:class 3 adenylate cyclase/Tfp pilus assembly protein PilF